MVLGNKNVALVTDETREVVVKTTELAPPVSLSKVGLILLALLGGGTAVYAVTRCKKEE